MEHVGLAGVHRAMNICRDSRELVQCLHFLSYKGSLIPIGQGVRKLRQPGESTSLACALLAVDLVLSSFIVSSRGCSPERLPNLLTEETWAIERDWYKVHFSATNKLVFY